MSILAVNFKHFYQRRGYWFVYANLGYAILSIVMMIYGGIESNWQLILLLFWAYFLGNIIASMQAEVHRKPFTYCLPKHRAIVCRFIIIAGFAVSLLLSIFFIYSYHELGFLRLLPILLSGFSVFLTFYLFGACFTFLMPQRPVFGLLVPPFILFLGTSYGLHDILVLLVECVPSFCIITAVLFSVLAWILSTDDSIVRQFCFKTVISSLDISSGANIQKKRQAIMAEKEPETNPKVEQFFLTRMLKCDPFGTGRYIWGSLYARFNDLKIRISVLILLLTLILLIFGYLEGTFFLFLFISFSIFENIPLYSNMLISGGRKERFITTIIHVVTNIFLITTFATIFAALSILIEDIMPELTLYGITYYYQAADIRLFFIPLLMIPIASIFNLLFYRKQSLVMILNVLFMSATIIIMLEITRRYEGFSSSQTTIYIPNPKVIVSLIALSWAMFVGVLYYISKRRPLIK